MYETVPPPERSHPSYSQVWARAVDDSPYGTRLRTRRCGWGSPPPRTDNVIPTYVADVEFYQYASDRLDRIISEIDREFPGGVFAKQLECLHRLKDEAGKHCSKTRIPSSYERKKAEEETHCYDQMMRSLEES